MAQRHGHDYIELLTQINTTWHSYHYHLDDGISHPASILLSWTCGVFESEDDDVLPIHFIQMYLDTEYLIITNTHQIPRWIIVIGWFFDLLEFAYLPMLTVVGVVISHLVYIGHRPFPCMCRHTHPPRTYSTDATCQVDRFVMRSGVIAELMLSSLKIFGLVPPSSR